MRIFRYVQRLLPIEFFFAYVWKQILRDALVRLKAAFGWVLVVWQWALQPVRKWAGTWSLMKHSNGNNNAVPEQSIAGDSSGSRPVCPRSLEAGEVPDVMPSQWGELVMKGKQIWGDVCGLVTKYRE